MYEQARLYRVERFGKPVVIETEFGETVTPIADMLRYDHAFQKPDDPSVLCFPVFRSKDGLSMQGITQARWRSFSCKLHEIPERSELAYELRQNMGEWVSFRHPTKPSGQTAYTELEPVTLDKYMQDNRLKVVKWR